MSKTLRLILFKDCNRSCKGCCNEDIDIENLETVKSFVGYDEIMLTGGEPMLKTNIVHGVISEIRKQNKDVKIILYTAKIDILHLVEDVIKRIDGITVTLHDQKDVSKFSLFYYLFNKELFENRSFRLNIFKGVCVLPRYVVNWEVKDNIEWIKNCPLPKNETLMKL